MESVNFSAGKVLYGAAFVIVLPILLVIWAIHTNAVVSLPTIHHPALGVCAVGVGLLLMCLGMASLWRLGGGLPMNAFPPPRYVSSGVYGLFSHPIYVGFFLVCVGTSVAVGSASGLWLISTTVALASAALVLGYELPDMQKRFGGAVPEQRLFPPDDDCPPSRLERVRCYLTVLIPWLVLYEGVLAIGVPIDARSGYFPFEHRLPVWPWSEIFYGSVYVVVLLAPLMARTHRDLRLFSRRALFSMLVVFPVYLTVPLIAPPRSFVPRDVMGSLLNFDRSLDGAGAAFPSYHVIWAFLAVSLMAGNGGWRRKAWHVWAWGVAASCVTTGMHAVVDVAAGLLVVALVMRMDRLWAFLRESAEGIANSWREWRIGPLRVINHGAYAAAGVFSGIWVLDTVLGQGGRAVPVAIVLGGTVGAVLWAQFIEGSPSLLRPLGFYGGMLGASIGALIAAAASGINGWVVLAALCVSAPWIQGIGRLRCLVQGCCHGCPTDAEIGIRYTHARSRVCRLTGLRDIPVHPTPLYSLLWNLLIAMVVTRLYLLHTKATLIGGIYLILCGLGRFVEEAYRGEPQTPVYAGLRLYQWIALATVAIGTFITTLTNAPATPEPVFHISAGLVAGACGVIAWAVAGVDFPESNRRFSRLA